MGNDLLNKVVAATGLPNDAVNEELGKIIERAGLERSDITIDELRRILAEYAQEVLLEAKSEQEREPEIRAKVL